MALGAAAANAATAAPSSLVTASLTAAAKQTSVHYVTVSSLGSQSISVVGDAATNAGQEAIVVTKGKLRGIVNARFDGQAVYYRANLYGLESYLGMPSTLAPKYTGKWISFTSADQNYPEISKSLTISSVVGDISLKPPMKLAGTKTINAQRTIGVSGTTTAVPTSGKTKDVATLYIATSANQLPVQFGATGKQKNMTEIVKVNFSRWGVPVNPQAPTTSIPASSISSGVKKANG